MKKIENRINETNTNIQGLKMTIINYVNCHNIIVKFEDGTEKKTKYEHFIKGNVLNDFFPSVCGVGVKGTKYPARLNDKMSKEYETWNGMLQRCYSEKYKEKFPTYQNVTCCEEWLYFTNFYEWLHSQENFDKWYNGVRWHLDKDILIKGNKIYSPDACCLVPDNINLLLGNSKSKRGKYPIGVSYDKDYGYYRSKCADPFGKEIIHHGFSSPEDAFLQYKRDKEFIIKQVALLEYKNGNITKKCHDALMQYNVEITD